MTERYGVEIVLGAFIVSPPPPSHHHTHIHTIFIFSSFFKKKVLKKKIENTEANSHLAHLTNEKIKIGTC